MRVFFDTNVLVYLFDDDAPEKQALARTVLQREVEVGQAVLSTQVLQEFFVATTRKLAVPLSSEDGERAVRDLAELTVIQVTTGLVLDAIRRTGRMGFSFWDALIIETALASGADRLLTEDLQHGQRIDGLLIENPFIT
ncbi:MAG: PIN domain-containing protein [Anaerolineae bacterium]